MGVTAALKACTVFENLQHLLVIELLAGRLALDYHAPLKGGRGVEGVAEALRPHVKPLKRDRVLHEDFKTIRKLVNEGAIDHVLAGLE